MALQQNAIHTYPELRIILVSEHAHSVTNFPSRLTCGTMCAAPEFVRFGALDTGITQLSEQDECGHDSRLMAKKFAKNNGSFNGEERKKENHSRPLFVQDKDKQER